MELILNSSSILFYFISFPFGVGVAVRNAICIHYNDPALHRLGNPTTEDKIDLVCSTGARLGIWIPCSCCPTITTGAFIGRLWPTSADIICNARRTLINCASLMLDNIKSIDLLCHYIYFILSSTIIYYNIYLQNYAL